MWKIFISSLKCDDLLIDKMSDFINGDFNNIFINHKNSAYFTAEQKKQYILISFYDKLQNLTIEIKINKKQTYPKKIGDSPSDPSISILEHCLESKKIINIYNNKDNNLQICNIENNKVISKNNVINLFQNNYALLNSLESLSSKNFDVYKNFKKHNPMESKSDLDNIIGVLGYPHFSITVADGYMFWLYFGSHHCKKNSCEGFYMLKINSESKICGTYKMINKCNCKTGSISKLIEQQSSEF